MSKNRFREIPLGVHKIAKVITYSKSPGHVLYIICSYFKTLKFFSGPLGSTSRKLLTKSRNQNILSISKINRMQILKKSTQILIILFVKKCLSLSGIFSSSSKSKNGLEPLPIISQAPKDRFMYLTWS